MADDVKIVCEIKFNNIPAQSRIIKSEAMAVIEKAALDIEALAKDACPVKTGNLKDSISAYSSEDGMTWTVGPRGPLYGIFVEMGTVHKGARPYMRPAADAVGPTFIEAMKLICR